MKGKTLSIHSSRGGTGKTVIATNLAVALANRGSNVALIDMDFRAPSLSVVFSKQINDSVKYWLNDYLENRCTARQIVIELHQTGLKGKLFLVLANPAIEAITGVIEKSREWEVSALKKLFALRAFLFDEMNVDYCVFDTSPGVQYSSVNAAVASDLSIIVTTLDMLDMDGVKRLLLDLYDSVSKKTVVLLNKVYPETCLWSESKQKELIRITETALGHQVIGIIPCYCHVLKAGRVSFLFEDKRFLPFIKNLDEIVTKLEAVVIS